MKLNKKFLLSYITIIAVPIIIYSIKSFNIIETRNIEEIIRKHKYELELEYEHVSRNVDTMGNIAQMIISNKEVIDYVSNSQDYSVNQLITFNQNTYKEIMRVQNNNPTIKAINIFTDNNRVYELWPLIYRENRVTQNSWYSRVIKNKGQVYWNINQFDNDIKIGESRAIYENDVIVSLNRELRFPSDNHIGTIRVTMRSKDFFSNMFKDMDESYGIYLIDLNGEIYTNENGVFNKKNTINKDKLFNAFKRNNNSQEGKFNFKDGLNEYIVLYKEAPLKDSYLVDLISLNKVNEELKKERNTVILVDILLIFLFSISIYLINSKILKRLFVIIKSLKNVQEGNFNVEIPIGGRDEIGLLAHNFRQMLSKINMLIEDNVNKQMLTKEAELKALKNQIDAHFLYNTLENIRMMAEIEENFTVSDSLARLGDMMRYNMKWEKEYVTIAEEISHIKNYIALMAIRYENNINFKVEIDNNLMENQILKMTLQPLVENSLKHGLCKKLLKEDGMIIISAKADEDFVYISIEDNGCGISEEKLREINEYLNNSRIEDKNGLGIKNVNERIKLFYGEKYGISIISEEKYFTKILIKLPR
jgi:two-component system sensor histidine kinase YesM